MKVGACCRTVLEQIINASEETVWIPAGSFVASLKAKVLEMDAKTIKIRLKWNGICCIFNDMVFEKLKERLIDLNLIDGKLKLSKVLLETISA